MKQIYLDYAAATPMDVSVQKAMEPYFTDNFYNPAAGYLAAKAIKEDITKARRTIAAQLGAKYTEIINTSGGTESNNLAIAGVMEKFPAKEVLVSAIEHESVLQPAEKYKSRKIPVDKSGMVDLGKLERMISDETVLVSVMLVSNELGTLQPVRKIDELASRVRHDRADRGIATPIYLHTDACQAPCYLDVNVNRLGVDLLTLNGGKIYGPKGSGILFVRTGLPLQPQFLGGGQQRDRRSGTENPATTAGFAGALEMAGRKRKAELQNVAQLREEFIAGLINLNPDIVINGHAKIHSPHIVSVTFPGVDNERLLYQLEENGVLAASGSACSASSQEPSHVLKAIGLNESQAQATLRFSFGRQTNKADIKKVLENLSRLL